VLFALVWFYAAGVVNFLTQVALPNPALPGLTIGMKVALLVMGAPLALVFAFILSGILFVIWHLMGSTGNYQTAFRTWSAMSPLAVLQALLGVGVALSTRAFKGSPMVAIVIGVIMLFYGLYLLVTASVETHRLPKVRSWVVWGSVTVLLFLAGVILSAVALVANQNARGGGFGGTPTFGNFPVPKDGNDKELDFNFNEEADEEAAAPAETSPAQPPKKQPVKK
jgi:hypothetical protein